ncbi:MAG: hypothetical protein JO358_08635 [Alphaproteobacteria bacterium]|nr:hypothetical protein [Alphaproteobacteria bacterium]
MVQSIRNSAEHACPVSDDDAGDYKVGYKKPPLHTRFKRGQAGNPRGRPRGAKNFSSVLNDALNQPVVVTENGRRRKISKRELGIRQLVDKFAMAEVQATRMLLGLMVERERMVAAAPPAERPSFGAADEKVIDNLLKRLRGTE